MGVRRVARECAVQMLYQYDVGRHEIVEAMQLFWEMNEHAPRIREFANHLFVGCIERLEEIDSLIQAHTENWRLGRMAAVDRNILRLGVYELMSEDKTPATVVINEALEIAKKFSTHESAQFVNGILDSIRKELSVKNTK